MSWGTSFTYQTSWLPTISVGTQQTQPIQITAPTIVLKRPPELKFVAPTIPKRIILKLTNVGDETSEYITNQPPFDSIIVRLTKKLDDDNFLKELWQLIYDNIPSFRTDEAVKRRLYSLYKISKERDEKVLSYLAYTIQRRIYWSYEEQYGDNIIETIRMINEFYRNQNPNGDWSVYVNKNFVSLFLLKIVGRTFDVEFKKKCIDEFNIWQPQNLSQFKDLYIGYKTPEQIEVEKKQQLINEKQKEIDEFKAKRNELIKQWQQVYKISESDAVKVYESELADKEIELKRLKGEITFLATTQVFQTDEGKVALEIISTISGKDINKILDTDLGADVRKKIDLYLSWGKVWKRAFGKEVFRKKLLEKIWNKSEVVRKAFVEVAKARGIEKQVVDQLKPYFLEWWSEIKKVVYTEGVNCFNPDEVEKEIDAELEAEFENTKMEVLKKIDEWYEKAKTREQENQQRKQQAVEFAINLFSLKKTADEINKYSEIQQNKRTKQVWEYFYNKYLKNFSYEAFDILKSEARKTITDLLDETLKKWNTIHLEQVGILINLPDEYQKKVDFINKVFSTPILSESEINEVETRTKSLLTDEERNLLEATKRKYELLEQISNYIQKRLKDEVGWYVSKDEVLEWSERFIESGVGIKEVGEMWDWIKDHIKEYRNKGGVRVEVVGAVDPMYKDCWQIFFDNVEYGLDEVKWQIYRKYPTTEAKKEAILREGGEAEQKAIGLIPQGIQTQKEGTGINLFLILGIVLFIFFMMFFVVIIKR